MTKSSIKYLMLWKVTTVSQSRAFSSKVRFSMRISSFLTCSGVRSCAYGKGRSCEIRREYQGQDIFESGDHSAYNSHCVEAKSDVRDVGQVLRHLMGNCRAEILDVVADDMTDMYGGVPPTWVAGRLNSSICQLNRERSCSCP